MNTALLWLAIASAALLLVAIGVAWLEHRHRSATLHNELAWLETVVEVRLPGTDTTQALHTNPHHGAPDVVLEMTPDEREQVDRQAVLSAALDRMSQLQADQDQHPAWADTQPLVIDASAAPVTPRQHSAVG